MRLRTGIGIENMKKSHLLIVIMSVLISFPATAQEKSRQLTEQVKSQFISAKPINNSGVDRAFFDGKPVLVVFFASW